MVNVGGAAALYPVYWHRKHIPTGQLDTSWVGLQFVLPPESGFEERWADEVLLESRSESVLAVCAFVRASLLLHCTCLSHVRCEPGWQLNSSARLPPVGKCYCCPQVVCKPVEANPECCVQCSFCGSCHPGGSGDGVSGLECDWPSCPGLQIPSAYKFTGVFKMPEQCTSADRLENTFGHSVATWAGRCPWEVRSLLRSCQCTVVHGSHDVVCAYFRIVFFLLF